MTSQEAFDQVLAGIKAGELDLQLNMLSGTISMRRDTLARQKGYTLQIGDIVVFNDKTHPRYMIGKRAKVLDVNQVTAWVELLSDEKRDAGKFGKSSKIRVPFSLIDKQ